MGAEKVLVNVNKGQDAYSVIGNYILNHVAAIEDMIAVIQINGVIIKELYMVDVDADGYFYWKSDWWEGEEDVALLDFFPVSDAERIKWIPCEERLPEKSGQYYVSGGDKVWICEFLIIPNFVSGWCGGVANPVVQAWLPRPEPYREGVE